MDQELIAQIMTVRQSGKTNMLDIRNVQLVALALDCYDLAEYLSDRRNVKEYCKFILYGKGGR
jgi:hypothetical protein